MSNFTHDVRKRESVSAIQRELQNHVLQPPMDREGYYTERVLKGELGGNMDTEPQVVADFLRREQVDVRLMSSVVLGKNTPTADKGLMQRIAKRGAVLAASGQDALAPARRTQGGVKMAQRAYDFLLARPLLQFPGMAEKLLETCEQLVYAKGGTQFSLRRLAALPRKGAVVEPPEQYELARALTNCGIPTVQQCRELASKELTGPEGVSVNKKASNGFPTRGKMEQADSAALVVTLAEGFIASVDQQGGTMEAALRVLQDLEASTPEMVLVEGKTKADYYKEAKVREHKMRHYTVFPRWLSMIAMMAAQPLEGATRNILQDPLLHTAQGATLMKGGAGKLVEALDEQMMGEAVGYVHCGDDSLVVVERPGGLEILSVDMSNFDLTQHAAVRRGPIGALTERLQVIAPTGAAAFAYMAAGRLEAVNGACVIYTEHGGASGGVLQSKLNDIIMDVYLQRVTERIGESQGREAIDALLQEVGREMGLDARLEQYAFVKARSLREALETVAVQFLGYYLYAEGGIVACVADLPRMLARGMYPNYTYRTEEEHKDLIALRAAGAVLNLGVVPMGWEGLEKMMVDRAVTSLELRKARLEKRLNLVADATDGVVRDTASFDGLLELVKDRRQRLALWLEPKGEEVEQPTPVAKVTRKGTKVQVGDEQVQLGMQALRVFTTQREVLYRTEEARTTQFGRMPELSAEEMQRRLDIKDLRYQKMREEVKAFRATRRARSEYTESETASVFSEETWNEDDFEEYYYYSE